MFRLLCLAAGELFFLPAIHHKKQTELTASQGVALLRRQMESIGYEVAIGRGDYREKKS